MHVSPASDDQRPPIHVASDAEMQTVIEFLSNSQTGFDESEADGGNHFSSEPYEYQEAGYFAGSQREWGQRRKAQSKSHPPPSDNSSSGSSGVGMEDGYNMSHMRSRSTSMSPGMDGKEFDGHSGRSKEGGHDDSSYHNMKGSPDSGINIHSRPGKKKGWDREPGDENVKGSHSQDLPIDLSKGLGPLIPSNPRRQGALSDLSYSMDMLNLTHLKGMAGDSDSEISG